VDALKRASASAVTAVVPFFSYAKGDKKDEPRVSIRARVCADMIEAAGADRVLTMDLHAPQIQGFFKIPVDHLYAMTALCKRIRALVKEELVVVSPDVGFGKQARKYGTLLNASVAIGDKYRSGHDERPAVLHVIGDVRAKTAVIVDDFVTSGGSMAEMAGALKELGAGRVLAAVTHGVLSAGAAQRIDDSPIEKLLITDTVETHPEPLSAKIEVVSVAELFAEAVRSIYERTSISRLFPEDIQN
jgi:ribose-phosphate pyrophosphokinase